MISISSPTTMLFNEEVTPDGGQKMSAPVQIQAGPGVGTWTHVDLQITFPTVAVSGKVAVTIGGQTALMHPLTFPAGPLAKAVAAIGMLLGNAPNVWKLRYDNVTIDRTT